MLRRLVLAVLFASLSLSYSVAQYRLELGPVASIEFPRQPGLRELRGQRVYTVADSTCLYNVIVQAIDTVPDFRIRRGEVEAFYQDIAAGTLQAVGQPTNVRRQSFTIDGLTGSEIRFSAPNATTGFEEYTFRFLYLNGYLLSYSTAAPKNPTPPAAEQAQAFLASLRVAPQAKAAARQYTLAADGKPLESQGYYLGSLLGRIGSLLLVAGLAIWLIRRFARPRA